METPLRLVAECGSPDFPGGSMDTARTWRTIVEAAAVIGAIVALLAYCQSRDDSEPPRVSTSPSIPLVTPQEETTESASPAPSPVAEVAYLSEMQPVERNYDPTPGAASINGSDFPQSISFQVHYAANPVNEVSYNIGRDWRYLAATVGVTDDSTSDTKLKMQAFADGRSVYEHVFSYGESNPVSLDVKGVLRLTFKVSLIGGGGGGTYIGAWGDARLKAN
ncbi:NPCBM/NEW2 domain-containing protein [Streptomyces sp. NPDC040724]|uniref:NPCBM/NEW2 domain-containing protein n=1 Tax=Streptomyces sp. NPDC040724 TaxID=3155612 RepID=UPI0033C50FC6